MPTLVELKGIRKSFSGVTVLKGVDFSLDSGEVQATKRPLQVQHAAAHLLGSTGARKISDNNRHLPIVLAHTVTACV